MIDRSNLLPTARVLVVFQQRAVANWSARYLPIRDCLAETGYVVAVTERYDDALPALCMNEADAVVVGVTRLDGHTEAFLARLELDPHAIGIPTVLITPTKSHAGLARIAARKNPRIGYLSWPLKCRDLRLVVQDLLRTGTQPATPAPGRWVVLDPRLRVLRGRAGVTVVTPGEYRLADYLISQRGRPVPLPEIQARVFSFSPGDASPALVRAHVASLRQKVKVVTGGSDLIRPTGKSGIVYLGGRRRGTRHGAQPS
jgi:DNA-binding response OmpR family regulator